MRKATTLILEREDLLESSQGKHISLLSFGDFKISNQTMQQEEIIMFIDKNCQTKLLKNRYGDKGNGCFIEILERIRGNNQVAIALGVGLGDNHFKNAIEELG